MLYTYGGSFQGRSHVIRNIVCQDYSINAVIDIDGKEKIAVLVAADGVGSAKHAEDGSRIAAETCFSIIKAHKVVTEEVLREAYSSAFEAVVKKADLEENPVSDYDTTLSVAILFDSGKLIYGHSGDGGIVGIRSTGEYVALTKPQKGPDGQSVIPLRFGQDYWEFSKIDDVFSSIMVMTDGVLDVCVPSLLRNQRSPIYVPFVRFFADNNVLDVERNGIDEVRRSRLDFLNSDSCATITDDRTLLVAINASKDPTILDEDYYAEPDWENLREEWKRKAYPHLYKGDVGCSVECAEGQKTDNGGSQDVCESECTASEKTIANNGDVAETGTETADILEKEESEGTAASVTKGEAGAILVDEGDNQPLFGADNESEHDVKRGLISRLLKKGQ